jgi:hypothetical protein
VIHAFFVGLAVLLMGVLCLTSASDLVSTPLGRRVAKGLAAYWGLRLLVQLFGYSSRLWRGKAFETSVHVTFCGPTSRSCSLPWDGGQIRPIFVDSSSSNVGHFSGRRVP